MVPLHNNNLKLFDQSENWLAYAFFKGKIMEEMTR
jgi:hypothetical protein